MRRTVTIGAVAIAAGVAFVPSASATIHPIVESFDCANAKAFAHHPLGDPADPIGQTPGDWNHSVTSTFRAVIATGGPSSPAWFGHKLDEQCGKVGQ